MGWFDGLTGWLGGNTDTTSVSVPDVNMAVAPDASLGNLAGSVTGYPAAAGTTPDMGSGGGFSWDSILGGLGTAAQYVAPVAGLATTGMGIASGIQGMLQGAQQQKILHQAQRQQQQIAAPAAAAGAALTGAGQQAMLGGALPPQLESQVKQKTEEMRAQIRAYLAHAGITDSTMAQEYEGWIMEREQELRSQLSQNLLQSGYTGVATAMGPTGALAQEATGQMGGVASNLQSANRAIALLTGSTDDRQKQQVG